MPNSLLARLFRFLAMMMLIIPLGLTQVGCDDDKDAPKTEASDEAAAESGDAAAESGGDDEAAAKEEDSNEAAADDVSDEPSSSSSNSGMKILCIGDSITFGVGTSDPYPSKLARLTGASVVNSGVTSQQSSRGASRIGGELSRHKPTHVCILFGTNDVRVGNDLGAAAGSIQSMVNAVRSAGAKAIVGTLPPLLEKDGSLQKGIDEMNGRIRGISGASIADIARDFGSGAGTINGDGIHPNNNGAAIIAVNMSERL